MNKKLSIFQLSLISTGGMLGCGWLFSPFYGYQTAGIGVIFSWLITAVLTLIIGLTFAEICSRLPVVGGIYRLIGITHHKSLASLFLILGWLSYVVYLPLEAQSVIQYLGYWVPQLLHKNSTNQVELSRYGIAIAALIILAMTWFNTLVITKVAKANNLVSVWKIIIPLLVALVVIVGYGKWEHLLSSPNFSHFNFENVLLAVSSSGLAFAFSGFQNGLILANQVQNPEKALPYSLFTPIVVGLVIYLSLSLCYLASSDSTEVGVVNAAAPLMGLLALLGLNWLFTILFIDAIIAPLGTTNVYIAVTARILYSLAKAIRPLSRLTHKNVNNSPVVALWVNGLIGVVFLFPFPTWKELVNFLSSIVVFAYLAGPISLLVIHSKKHDLTTNFNVPFPKLVGYAAFVCCSWLIYWSGLANLGYLMITLIVSQIIYCIFASEITGIFQKFKHNWYVFAYVGVLWLISYLHEHHKISFPHDNVLIAIIGIIFCYIFVFNRLPHKLIKKNIITLYEERLIDNYLH